MGHMSFVSKTLMTVRTNTKVKFVAFNHRNGWLERAIYDSRWIANNVEWTMYPCYENRMNSLNSSPSKDIKTFLITFSACWNTWISLPRGECVQCSLVICKDWNISRFTVDARLLDPLGWTISRLNWLARRLAGYNGPHQKCFFRCVRQ